MIVIAVIGILATIAIPQYSNYTQRAKFTEIISKTNSIKTAVSICYQEKRTLNICSGSGDPGDYAGIPADFTTAKGYVQSIKTENGTITARGISPDLDVDDDGVGESFILVPTPSGSALTWKMAANSTCIAANLCKR